RSDGLDCAKGQRGELLHGVTRAGRPRNVNINAYVSRARGAESVVRFHRLKKQAKKREEPPPTARSSAAAAREGHSDPEEGRGATRGRGGGMRRWAISVSTESDRSCCSGAGARARNSCESACNCFNSDRASAERRSSLFSARRCRGLSSPSTKAVNSWR